MSKELGNLTMSAIADITTECEKLVMEHLEDRGLFPLVGRSWPQTISGSRYSIHIGVDLERFRKSCDHGEQNKCL